MHAHYMTICTYMKQITEDDLIVCGADNFKNLRCDRNYQSFATIIPNVTATFNNLQL